MRRQSWQVFDREGHRKYTTQEERTRFLAAIPPFPRVRYSFCVALVYTGARISEMLALGSHHVGAGELTFRTLKRRKLHFRVVPVPPHVIRLLRALGRKGRLFGSINRSTAYRWVRAVAKRAGIEGPQACPKGGQRDFCALSNAKTDKK